MGSAYTKGKVSIHNNAIETSKYEFSPKKNEIYRNEFKIPKDAFVIGHVGRIGNQKNQIRLINIFNEIYKKETNSYLILIGSEDQEKDVLAVQEMIKVLNLTEHILLLGIRNDVPELLNMMDVFVFPSKYEGLPFTLIETQCNGLMAISSDAVTSQVKVSNCVEFLSLDETNEKWASTALALRKKNHLKDARQDVIKAGYDIDVESAHLKEYYLSLKLKRKSV
ncbi:MAG: glycosyltransferase [Thomasclavelia sp.]